MKKKKKRLDGSEAFFFHEEWPEDPLERCNLRWIYLFEGIQKALGQKDLTLLFGLEEAFKRFGLADNEGYLDELFDPNPTDDILEKIRAFRVFAKLPNLRGRRPSPENVYRCALMDYSLTISVLKQIPQQKLHDRELKYAAVRTYIPEIKSKMSIPDAQRKVISDKDLRGLMHLPVKALARNIMAHFYGVDPDTFKKYLTNAKKLEW